MSKETVQDILNQMHEQVERVRNTPTIVDLWVNQLFQHKLNGLEATFSLKNGQLYTGIITNIDRYGFFTIRWSRVPLFGGTPVETTTTFRAEDIASASVEIPPNKE